MGRVGWGRAITWDDGVHADRGVASQREAKVLLPPVHANDPDEEEEAKIRFRLRVCHVFVVRRHDQWNVKERQLRERRLIKKYQYNQ